MSDEVENRGVIAIDPGTSKCGIAILSLDGEVEWKGIVARDQVIESIEKLLEEYPGMAVAVGGTSHGRKLLLELSERADITTEVVDETDSTMLARDLFWRENRPGCLWGIFPPSFRPLPRPIDDYAAIIIGRRFLGLDEG